MAIRRMKRERERERERAVTTALHQRSPLSPCSLVHWYTSSSLSHRILPVLPAVLVPQQSAFKMSGRFFKHISDSDSESSESDEDIQGPRQPAPVVTSYSSDEEEARRVVRTTKEKRFEELHTIIKQIRNFKKIKDFSKMLTAFENLCKAYTKAKTVIDKEEGGVVPRFYLRCLVEIGDLVDETW